MLTPNTCLQAAIEHVVPPFYFPGGKPVSEDVRVSAQAKIDAFFEIYPDGLTIPAVKELVKEVRLTPGSSQSMGLGSWYAPARPCVWARAGRGRPLLTVYLAGFVGFRAADRPRVPAVLQAGRSGVLGRAEGRHPPLDVFQAGLHLQTATLAASGRQHTAAP